MFTTEACRGPGILERRLVIERQAYSGRRLQASVRFESAWMVLPGALYMVKMFSSDGRLTVVEKYTPFIPVSSRFPPQPRLRALRACEVEFTVRQATDAREVEP